MPAQRCLSFPNFGTLPGIYPALGAGNSVYGHRASRGAYWKGCLAILKATAVKEGIMGIWESIDKWDLRELLCMGWMTGSRHWA